jgi:hypothetical protein
MGERSDAAILHDFANARRISEASRPLPDCFLLLTSDSSHYCGLAISPEIGEGILDANHSLDATFGTALLLLNVPVARFFGRSHTCQPCLAYVGKVCDMFVKASGNAAASRFDVAADFFDIRAAGTDTRSRHRTRHEK